MRSFRTLLVFVIVLCSAGRGLGQEQDLRDRFGTRSLEAARQIARAIELSQAKKYRDAIAAVDAAIKADGQAQIAYYWKGNILANLGEVPESIAAYKKCLSGDVVGSRSVTGSAAFNLGLLLGKLNEFDESNVYFTRAVLADFDNAAGFRGLAYRTLAVNAERRGQYLSSSLALSFALQDKAKNVSQHQIDELLRKGQDQEVVRVLFFAEQAPKLPRRGRAATLAPVSVDGAIAEPIADLWPDPQGRYVLAVPLNGRRYYLITTTPRLATREVPVAGPILCTCLAGERLYAVAGSPARIDVIVPETGKVAATHDLKGRAPTSLAVLPAHSRAFFPAEGVIADLNLKTGAFNKTALPADSVVGHPSQRFVLGYIKTQRPQWLQSPIIKAVVVPNGLLLAELRDNAASNAWRISVSPDGHWVGLAGGGGWRPIVRRPESGYGVAVFSAWNLDHWQGFFPTDRHPLGVCFNPVTGQVAAIREQDASVYHMADPKTPSRLGGPFRGVGAWSGDGRYLFLAREKKGLACWSNALTADESRIAATWWETVKVAQPAATPPQMPAFRVVAAVQGFRLAEPRRDEIAAELAQALAADNAAKPPAWRLYTPYLKDEELRRVVQQAEHSLRDKENFGITIYQARTALKTYPGCTPLRYILAEALRQGNQSEEAERAYLGTIQGDAGRTELTCQSLNQLASLLASQGKDLSALHCLTTSLSLDRANPRTLALTADLLRKLGLAKEAEHLKKLAADLPSLGGDRPAELPRLSKPTVEAKLSAAHLYRTSVGSVVLIQAGDVSGSGVCIASPDTILTNHHVVEGSDNIGVFPFADRGGTLVRLPRLKARVVFQSERDDLAVLKLEQGSADLHPMPVAEGNPAVGERVYAIGSPALGDDVLEQSVSEGIISGAGRIIEGAKYLQHTAAINPGNSGGPLIDEWGRLVGIVTLKTDLPNVGFAVPVVTIRTVFKNQ